MKKTKRFGSNTKEYSYVMAFTQLTVLILGDPAVSIAEKPKHPGKLCVTHLGAMQCSLKLKWWTQ